MPVLIDMVVHRRHPPVVCDKCHLHCSALNDSHFASFTCGGLSLAANSTPFPKCIGDVGLRPRGTAAGMARGGTGRERKEQRVQLETRALSAKPTRWDRVEGRGLEV